MLTCKCTPTSSHPRRHDNDDDVVDDVDHDVDDHDDVDLQMHTCRPPRIQVSMMKMTMTVTMMMTGLINILLLLFRRQASADSLVQGPGQASNLQVDQKYFLFTKQRYIFSTFRYVSKFK